MKTVLIVDDMQVFRQLIATCLRAKGFVTLTAGNGMEALDILKSQHVDLVLLDLGMPVMDGLAFLRAINDDKHIQRPPVVILTAMTEKDYLQQAAEMGVHDHLLKSQFSLKELLVRVVQRLNDEDDTFLPGGPGSPSLN